MFLRNDVGEIVDSEFSIDVQDERTCIVIESSGGSSPSRGVSRRNPDYNALVGTVLQRLARAGTPIEEIILDSAKVASLPVAERRVDLDIPYPIDVSAHDSENLRKAIGRSVSLMHRSQEASKSGNAQKRIRIVLAQPIPVEQLCAPESSGQSEDELLEYAPSLSETERQYMYAARVGQGAFRAELLRRYKGGCPVTGITHEELLIASHIKPWRICTNHERLDAENGILLSALVDRLFDKGLVSFESDGTILFSARLSAEDRRRCHLEGARCRGISAASQRYLVVHRKVVFK